MHREHRGRSQPGEGISKQKKPTPKGPALLPASLAGLLAQPLHHPIKRQAPGRTQRWQEAKGQLTLAGLHRGGEGVDHRNLQVPRGAADDAEVGQIAALRCHIPHHQLPVGAQHHVGLLAALLPRTAGRRHHRGASNQHLARQHWQLIGHGAMQGPPGDRDQLLQGAVRVAENAGEIGGIGFGAAAQGLLGRHQPAGTIEGTNHALVCADRHQGGRGAAGKLSLPQAGGQSQHGALVAHHLQQAGAAGPPQGEHGA